VRRPDVLQLRAPLLSASRAIAERLRSAGHRAWIVGGAVRDLALELDPADVDMATAARPEEIERLFEHVIPVGRAFGTLIVNAGGTPVQVSTFRAERGYSDLRRPDEVRFGSTLEEDARRRDFTCNALYLDPLEGTLVDPVNGLDDIRDRRLRCVGDPLARFREDGLRLVRMARFAAVLEFRIEPEVLEAARASVASLAGVSAERRLAEFALIFARRNASQAMRILIDCGLMEALVPALAPGSGRLDAGAFELRWRALDALGDAPGLETGLAVLFDPDPEGGGGSESRLAAASAALETLRPSRETRGAVRELWALAREIDAVSKGSAPRSRRVLLVRAARFDAAAHLARAWRSARRVPATDIDALELFARSLSPAERSPAPLVTPADLAALGIAPGPRWGELLRDAEMLQLDGKLSGREEALAWLAGEARRAQDGGKTRRNENASG
jgi:tRNA nucleotidyltransferase/poly(A) polymerase